MTFPPTASRLAADLFCSHQLFVDNRSDRRNLVIVVTQRLSNCGTIMAGPDAGSGGFTLGPDVAPPYQADLRIASATWEAGMRSIELADFVLAAVTIFLMCAVLLASMPGWQ